MWMTDVKGTQIEGLRGYQGYRYRIHGRYNSRGDVLTHDFPLSILINSLDSNCSMRTGEIIHVAELYHLKMGSLCVVWHAKIRK